MDPTSGHLGVMKTGNRIKERFMWKGIWNDVRKIVSILILLSVIIIMFHQGSNL